MTEVTDFYDSQSYPNESHQPILQRVWQQDQGTPRLHNLLPVLLSSNRRPSVMLTLMDLPDEAWQQVAGCLSAGDILSLLSTCKIVQTSMGQCPLFWKCILGRYSSTKPPLTNERQSPPLSMSPLVPDDASWKEMKEACLIQEQLHNLNQVKWLPILDSNLSPSSREGHNSCLIGHDIVVTGGFVSDTFIYVTKKYGTGDWQRLVPSGDRPDWVYGASLTPLDNMRAIRFGGFRGGGYSGETNQVAILTLHRSADNAALRASWEVVNCSGSAYESPSAPRAYHTATVLFHRYVLFIGGMQSHRSIFDPLILDTETWTFYSPSLSEHADRTWMRLDPAPSPRHGHSTILDMVRRRLVIFGGGNGTDLLQSGSDNSEVWECSLGSWSGEPLDELSLSAASSGCPFNWRRIHEDQNNRSSEASASDETSIIDHGPNSLSPSETLNLGRCHWACLISPDRALLVFGSGRPSTNGLLAYDLAKDQFHRMKVKGPLPMPRFTFAAVLLPHDGYVYIHGGYSTCVSDTLGDSIVLDLAPGLDRTLQLLPVRPNVRSRASVTDDQVLVQRQPYSQRDGHSSVGHAIFQLLAGLRRRQTVDSDADNAHGDSTDEDYEE